MKNKTKEFRMSIVLIIIIALLAYLIYTRFIKSYIPDMQKIMKKSLINNSDYIYGEGINSTDENGWTPLHTSVFIGEFEITKKLLENGADTEIKNNNGETPLILSSSSNFCIINFECIKLLLDNNAYINSTNRLGETPLMLAVSKDVLELLLTYLPNLNMQDNNGQTVLHHSVRKLDKGILKRVIKIKDIDLTIKDNNGFTAYEYAADQDYHDAIEILKSIN